MLTAVTAMAVLSLALAFGLAMAARIFSIETDPRVEQIERALPGANCGACGFPGCSELARRIAEGKAGVDSCPVGGEPVAHEIARLMGQAFEGGCERKVALVLCNGSDQVAAKRFFYNGVYDCASAALVFGGDKACTYGCLGFGTCAAVCPFGAIDMLPGGLAVVDPARCTGCTKCVKACPRRIIRMVPAARMVHILCSSHEKGAAAKKKCAVACIACQKCVKAAPEGAISMDDNLAVVGYAVEIPVSVAGECPMNTIVVRSEAACIPGGQPRAAAGGEG
jgi:electron transport complex protein RnfB